MLKLTEDTRIYVADKPVDCRKANTLEQLEELLPYNIDPSLLTDMRSLPNLIMPEKSAVN